MVVRQGEKDPFIRNVFTLNSCAPVVGSDVLCYDSEQKLLQVGLVCMYYNLVIRPSELSLVTDVVRFPD